MFKTILTALRLLLRSEYPLLTALRPFLSFLNCWLVCSHCLIELLTFILYVRHLSLSAKDGYWHHICVSWENTAGSLNVYKDGMLSASDRNFKAGHTIRAQGSMMLGQNQAGGLDSARSYQGFLSNLNVWDYVLCQVIITRMSKACLSGEGNVHKWSHFKHGIEGNALRLFIPSPCAPPGKWTYLYVFFYM